LRPYLLLIIMRTQGCLFSRIKTHETINSNETGFYVILVTERMRQTTNGHFNGCASCHLTPQPRGMGARMVCVHHFEHCSSEEKK